MIVAGERDIAGVHVRIWSGGSGPALLYLHGFERHPGDAGFLRRLAQRHTVIAPEHPGFGAGDLALDRIHDIVDLALHYRRLVEQEADEPVDVIGHCLGGMIGADFAALCPHLVRRLVLVNSYGLWLDSDPLPDPFTLSPDQLERAKWHEPGRCTEPSADPEQDRGESAVLRSQNLGAASRWLWPIPDRGLRRRIASIQARTLVLHGTSDGLIPQTYAKEFGILIPQAELTLIDAAGHLPMLEAPGTWAAHVEAFLGSEQEPSSVSPGSGPTSRAGQRPPRPGERSCSPRG